MHISHIIYSSFVKGETVMYRSIEDYKREMMNMYNTAPKEEANTKSGVINNENALSAKGYLTVAVTTQKGTFPLKGARVTVKDTNGNRLYEEYTDESGRTEKMTLKTTSKENSESPDMPGNVAEYYNINIDAKDFIPIVIEGIPIFDGISTTQSFDMIFTSAAESSAPQIIKFNNEYTL